MSRYRVVGLATLVSFVIGIAALVLHLVFQWPTTDYRIRLYILLRSDPGTFGLAYFVLLAVIGVAAVWISVGRGWRQAAGAVAGALLAVVVLYSGLLSWTVWRRETNLTRLGVIGRTTAALAVSAGTMWLARRAARRGHRAGQPPAPAT